MLCILLFDLPNHFTKVSENYVLFHIFFCLRITNVTQVVSTYSRFVLSLFHGYSIMLNLPFVSICGVCLPCNLKNNGYACRVTI